MCKGAAGKPPFWPPFNVSKVLRSDRQTLNRAYRVLNSVSEKHKITFIVNVRRLYELFDPHSAAYGFSAALWQLFYRRRAVLRHK
jgi:hypothetical protein